MGSILNYNEKCMIVHEYVCVYIEVILCDLFFLYQIFFFFFILSCDSSLSGNKLHSTLLPHYPGLHLRGPALTQQPGGGVSSSDGGRPVVAHRGKLGAHYPVSANVAEGVHVALPCRHRQ